MVRYDGNMTDTIWDIHLHKLVEYCRNQNVAVYFKRGCDETYDVKDEYIEINSRKTKRNQLYLLLHEIGHHKVIKSQKFAKKFACLNDKKIARNLSNKIRTLEEEVVAWHIGEDIAEELDIPLDDAYQILKAKCLKTYAKWV